MSPDGSHPAPLFALRGALDFFFAARFFEVFLCAAFGHPMTEIFVLWLITSPFWPTISVGISSVPLQRFPFALSAG